MNLRTIRKPEHPVHDLIINRWSPRSFTGESLSEKEIKTLFEAARWAPSSYNSQPWRFIYATRDSPAWKTLFGLLAEFNQNWAKNAAVLLVIISKNTFDHNEKPSRTHSFCTGSAWENLALQATAMGLAAHGMEGFDYDKAKKELSIPDGYTVEAMAAVGKPDAKEKLSPDLQKIERRVEEKK